MTEHLRRAWTAWTQPSKTNISVFSLSACSICFILSSCSTIPFVFAHSDTSLFSVYIHPVHTKHNMCCKKQHGTFNTLLHSNSDLRHFYAKKEAKKKVYRNKKTSEWERIPSSDLRLFVLQQKNVEHDESWILNKYPVYFFYCSVLFTDNFFLVSRVSTELIFRCDTYRKVCSNV